MDVFRKCCQSCPPTDRMLVSGAGPAPIPDLPPSQTRGGKPLLNYRLTLDIILHIDALRVKNEMFLHVLTY